MLINCDGPASIDTLYQVLQLFHNYPTVHSVFRVVLPRHSQGLCGELSFWFLQWAAALGPNILWSTSPIQNPPQSQHRWHPYQCQELCVFGRFTVVWIECSCTVFLMRTMCMHEMVWRQMLRSTQILKVLGRMSFCCNTKFWYPCGGWFLIFLSFALVEQLHHCQLGALHLLGQCWSIQMTLGQSVCAVVKVNWACILVNHWSGGQLAMHHSCVVLAFVHHWIYPSSQSFYLPPVPDWCWWATGNFCAGYGCILPHLWDLPCILVGLGRAAIPPHTPCSPICSEFCACLEGSGMDKDHVSHSQGHCLAASVIMFLVVLHFLPLEKVSLPVGPLYEVPQLLDAFAGGGHGYQFWGNSKGDINGKWGCLPYNKR